MRVILFLLLTTLVFARENPFVPVVTNENNNIIKKEMFSSKKITLPNDARVIKSVIFKYQALNGSIKEIEYPINKAIDWHNPIIISTQKQKLPTEKFQILFLNLYIKNHRLFIQTQDKLIRNFILVKPFRYVIDFKANKNFLTYSKKTNTFIKNIVLGNHNGFYRVVLYLDGTYKTSIQKTEEGYLIEFK
jgi:hypothetical protein